MARAVTNRRINKEPSALSADTRRWKWFTSLSLEVTCVGSLLVTWVAALPLLAYVEYAGIAAAAESPDPEVRRLAADIGSSMHAWIWFLQNSAISIAALLLGALARCSERTMPVSGLLIFFGAQSFMNIYMKSMMSQVPLIPGGDLVGIPAPCFITGCQQLVAFTLMSLWFGLSKLTPYTSSPTPVNTRQGWLMIVILGVTFTGNIALNNLSVSMLNLSVVLVIRSCGPITVLMIDFIRERTCEGKVLDSLIMVFGCVCAALVVVGSSGSGAAHANHGEGTMRQYAYIGAAICMLSNVASAGELLTVRSVGNGLKLTPLDLLFYMPIPVAFFLIGPVFLLPHPVAWPDRGFVTDAEVIAEAVRVNPHSMAMVVLSGAFAVSYNALLYNIVQKISAAHAAYTSSFNKVATILLSFVFGLEHVPPMPWALIFGFGAVGNIGSFTLISVWKSLAKKAVQPVATTNGQVAPTRLGAAEEEEEEEENMELHRMCAEHLDDEEEEERCLLSPSCSGAARARAAAPQ